MSENLRETEPQPADSGRGGDGHETATMDNPASSEVEQPGAVSDVDAVLQEPHGSGTFSMAMTSSSEVVERQASAGNGAMAVSERRERQEVSTRFTAGSDFKGIIVQDSSDVSLSVGGQTGGIMTPDTLEKNLKRVQDVFVKTANYKRVKERLEKYGHVTISGASGEGKTSIALIIAADLRKQGYELVFVDDVDKFELRNCDLRGKKVCLILDDIFGTVGLSTDVPHLRSILQNLKHYLEDGKSIKEEQRETHLGVESAIRVIYTTKSYNLECGVAKLEGQEYYFFTGPSLLDLTKTKSCNYSPQEREQILKKQLAHHKIKLDPRDIAELCDTTDSLFGFPLICTLFCEFLSFQKEPAQFFRKPLFYLRREIDMIMERMNDQSAALILMLLCEDNLNLSQVEMESQNNVLEAHLQAVKSVVSVTSRTAVAKAIRCYRGTFFTDGDFLGFSHPTIYDACACALFKMNSSFVLNHCSIRFLYERVQAQQVKSTAIDNHLHIIYVSDAYYDTVAARLADVVAKGNYSMSITHPILKNKQIVDTVFQMLKLKKSNTIKRLLNTKDTKRLDILHAKEDEKHLLYWAVHAHSLYLVEKILDVGFRFSDEEIQEAFRACASCGNEAVLLLISSKYKSLLHQSILNESLLTATENNYKGVALALLDIGADVFQSKNDVGENVFQIARIKGFSQLGRAIFGFITKRLNATDLTGDFDFQSASHSALQYSCRESDESLSQFFLPVTDINARDSTGKTLAMIAALHGNFFVFKLLRSEGADVHITDDDNDTVLHLACQSGNNLIGEGLLPLFDINCRGSVGRMPVMTAGVCGKKDVFDLLVRKGADLITTDDDNDTVLHLACRGGNNLIVEGLLPLFDINCRGSVGCTPVMTAALFGKKDVFDLLVRKGADLTITDDYNDTVLHLACQGGNGPIVEGLLPQFDINCRGQFGRTPVMTAADFGKKDVFDLLVKKGADITITDDNNNTVLHLACLGGNSPIVECLLPQFDINCRGQFGRTPVMMAADFGKKDVFDLLVKNGADLTITDDNNDTILHLACQGGNNAIVESLLPQFDINCRGQFGRTPVMTAADFGKKDVFDLLVKKGADITITDDEYGTILHLACQGGNNAIVESLLSQFDINCREQFGRTPVMVAADFGKKDVFDLLVKNGADLTITDGNNDTILHLACLGGNNAIVESLLPQFDINCRGQFGRTPVMTAAEFGKKDVFDLLVKKGADITITDDNNDTILHLACLGGNNAIVESLLPQFDINCRGPLGRTPVMTAADFGKKDVFDLLVKKGADITITDDEYGTILHLACQGGNNVIVESLLSQFDINCRGQFGRTPVMVAADFGKKDVFDLFVKNGADLTITDDNNDTVLHLACLGGNNAIVESLLPQFDINCRGQFGRTPVMTAAEFGKKDVFDLLVKKGADLTITDDEYGTILHLACQGGNNAIVESLLPQFDVNCRGPLGRTPVMTAAVFGKKAVFDLFVKNGADLTITDDNNDTVLHLACQSGNNAIVESLLPQFDINCRGQFGRTPVMTAADFGKKDAFDLLVKKGADITITDDNNDTILHLACQGGNNAIVESLLPQFDINCRGQLGFTPVMAAAFFGKYNIWELLRNCGGDRVCVCDDNHTTLHTASRGGNMFIVEEIIGDFDINTKGLWGRTPLLEAARGGHISVLDFLVSRNADIKLVDNMGHSLLHVACIGGHLGMVKHVCTWLNIDDRDSLGWTPAMVAAVFGQSAVFDYLQQQDADLTLVDKTGDNLLTLALQGGCRQIIEGLSPDGQYIKRNPPWTRIMTTILTGDFITMRQACHENSPEFGQTDQFGDSLLHLACRGGNRKCVEYLLPFYDINVRGRHNWTPVMMAAVCGHAGVFKLLVEHKADLSFLSYTGECILTLAQRGQSNDIVKYLRSKSGNSRE